MTAFALTTTTINVPHLLGDYAADAKAHGRDVKIIVSGDRETPPQAAAICAAIDRESGVACEYLDVAAQEALMRRHPRLNALLPWDCPQRRNVAILKAAMDGADVVVTIDDDNFLATSDYFGGHESAGKKAVLETFGESGGWFNVCRFLSDENGRRFFPRGYGIAARRLPDGAPPVGAPSRRRVAVNAGLWLGDPDIDATTRLANPINVAGYSRADNFFVAAGAWAPFNSQNTALARDVLPAFFLSPHVGRYDDIFIGYVVKRIADHVGDGISFGLPLTRQNRNPHNLSRDLALERLGMKIGDDFVAALAAASLTASNYRDCALELCQQAELALRDADMAPTERAQMAAFFTGCRLWAEASLW